MIYNGKRLKGVRLFKEKECGDYLLVLNRTDCIGTAIAGNISSLCLSTYQYGYLGKSCYPVTWKKLSPNWQNAFRKYLD